MALDAPRHGVILSKAAECCRMLPAAAGCCTMLLDRAPIDRRMLPTPNNSARRCPVFPVFLCCAVPPDTLRQARHRQGRSVLPGAASAAA